MDTDNASVQLEQDLAYLGLLDKAHEIFTELGQTSALSYIRSSYRLLSKVYHPDLNPEGSRKAAITQQVLNRVKESIKGITDNELSRIIESGISSTETKRKKILVVEDELGVQRAFQRILTMEGYDCKIAVDGTDGYNLFYEFMPNLLLCDIVMPEMNGLELVSKLRKKTPKVKVVYMSGFFDISSIRGQIDDEVLRYGYRTLSKPFKASTVLQVIEDYLTEDSGEKLGVNTLA